MASGQAAGAAAGERGHKAMREPGSTRVFSLPQPLEICFVWDWMVIDTELLFFSHVRVPTLGLTVWLQVKVGSLSANSLDN